MAGLEQQAGEHMPGEIVGIPLRIGAHALSVLRITPEQMELHGDPGVALIELGAVEEKPVFALGGWNVERIAAHRGVVLPQPQEILDRYNLNSLHTEQPDSVSLAITRRALAGLAVQPYEFDLPGAPLLGMTKFGPVYRLGGDLIADYVETHGARAVWGSDIDTNGNENTGDNSYN